MNRSDMMRTYNLARTAARQGKLDPTRTNKALGILQSKDGGASKFDQYLTTTKGCSCPDHARTGKPCKHMIARMIEVRAAGKPQQATPKVYTAANGDVLMAEQRPGKYYLHTFRSESQFNEFAKSHPVIKFVRPADVYGKRQNPEADHREEY